MASPPARDLAQAAAELTAAPADLAAWLQVCAALAAAGKPTDAARAFAQLGASASELGQVALAAGVALNPGPEWSTDKAHGKSRLRLCFANPAPETIREGVAALAGICSREFGVPTRIANVERSAAG